MKTGFALLATILFLGSGAQAGNPPPVKASSALPVESCEENPDTFPLFPSALQKDSLLSKFMRIPERPENKPASPSIRLEANDDLAALSFDPHGPFSPYIGAAISLGPLPNYDPAIDTSQILAYGVGAGFGCALDPTTRLNFGYRLHIFPDSSPLGTTLPEDEEIHRLSFGLQKSF